MILSFDKLPLISSREDFAIINVVLEFHKTPIYFAVSITQISKPKKLMQIN